MKPLLLSLPIVVCTVLVGLLMTGLGFVPLFGGPGYESALAAGLIVPAFVAIATALSVSLERPEPWDGFVRGLEIALIVSALAYGTTLLHGLRAGFCDAADGTTLFALGPASGALLAGTWGALSGELAGRFHSHRWRRAIALLLAITAPAAGALLSLWRFYASPMVFGFDPFFGFFSGAVYDTVVSDAIGRLVTYRAGSAATLFAVGAAGSLLARAENGTLTFRPNRHPGVVWFAVAAAAASLIITAEGSRLGHWQTAGTIEAQLGGKLADDRCEVVFPRSLTQEAAALLLRDCSTQAQQVAKFLEVPSPPRVRAYLFANAQQKRALMGASNTAIAKPWRREVYLRLDTYPHPVLGHELAHVIAGAFGEGPFRIAGSYHGLLPNPGLIEGIAVSASPDDELLTPEQWSAAMLKIGVLPKLHDVFALGFLGQNSDLSYTAAGAFVSWLRAKKGPYAIATWYAGASIESVTGVTLVMLENEWREALGKIALPSQAIEVAKARFDRPGVFGRRCPHAVDALNMKAKGLLGEGDCAGASVAYRGAAAIDPHDVPSRFGLAACSSRVGSLEDARASWAAMVADETMPAVQRSRAQEMMADLALMSGDAPGAEAQYGQLLGKTFDEDALRTLDVKLWASQNPVEARAVVELLMGTTQRPSEPKLAYALLGRWMAEAPLDGLPAYLIGRNLAGAGLWRESAEFLDWALQRRLPEERVRRETLRIRVVVACALGDDDTARRLYATWKATPGVPEIRWEVMERRLGMCVLGE